MRLLKLALLALAERIARPRYVCPDCRERTHSIAAHAYANHAGEELC